MMLNRVKAEAIPVHRVPVKFVICSGIKYLPENKVAFLKANFFPAGFYIKFFKS